MPKLVILLFLLTTSLSGVTQDFEGIIIYKISYSDLPKEMEGSAEMMPDNQTFYIKKEKSRFEMVTLHGTTVVFNDTKAQTTTVLIEAMGQKFKMTLSNDEMDEFQSNRFDEYKVTYQRGKKTIAGYECKKVLVESVDTKTTIEIFYTEQIQPMNIKGLEGITLTGMPLEYIIKSDEITMTVVVDKVDKKKIGDEYFVIPEGYQEMPEGMKSIFANQ